MCIYVNAPKPFQVSYIRAHSLFPRRGGELLCFNPETLHNLTFSVMNNSPNVILIDPQSVTNLVVQRFITAALEDEASFIVSDNSIDCNYLKRAGNCSITTLIEELGVSKCDPRIELLGELDTVQAHFLKLLLLSSSSTNATKSNPMVTYFLEISLNLIKETLNLIGGSKQEYEVLLIQEHEVLLLKEKLEYIMLTNFLDDYKKLDIRGFLLFKRVFSVELNFARTIVRRAELVAHKDALFNVMSVDSINVVSVALNELSHYLYILAVLEESTNGKGDLK